MKLFVSVGVILAFSCNSNFSARVFAGAAATLGSDLHFLFHNDLNWPTAQDHNGTIFLATAMPHTKAVENCGKLNEGLLSTSGLYFKSDIQYLVQYLVHDEHALPTQAFWVAGQNPTDCQTYSLMGGLAARPCNTSLPTFCSQQAPYRPNTNVDQNPAFEFQVQSGNITFVGNRDHLSFRFLGIPYANPVQRFAYSNPYTTSTPVTLLVTRYGTPCPQSRIRQEDRLFLNIYTPYIPQNPAQANSKKKLKPVIVWIHGGALAFGESDSLAFDGGNMASRNDLVYVSINYRVGPLGFLTLNDGIVNGNFGVGDLVTALRWIQTHIAAFGGDSSRVTINGESAGGGLVRALLSSPPAFGLFRGAIAQSTPGGFKLRYNWNWDFPSIQEEYKIYDAPFIKSLGCDKSATSNILECLKKIPADSFFIITFRLKSSRSVVVDGHYITGSRLGVNGEAPVAQAHVIFGWMQDDGAAFLGSLPPINTTQKQNLIDVGVPIDLAEKIAANPKVFPPATGSNASFNIFNLTSRVLTAGAFACAAQAIVKSAAKHKVFPAVYSYSFDRSYSSGDENYASGACSPPQSVQFPLGDTSRPYFRCHGGELYYTAGTLGQVALPFRDSGDLLLSQITMDAWGSFARTFNPNPSFAYLVARGYDTSAEAFRQAAPWEPISGSVKLPLRLMDVPLGNAGWRDTKQCNLLGLPGTIFESPTESNTKYMTDQELE
ncbi:cholinesterase [Crepidotus variabilis]|uniref:Cholinesterase n=1 Tax=Crepidotus variabilis TaxID=179855 RepID=A0A9P6JNI4_9AGAR|nr:cholinesterase [Crepidotus variabilis]